MREAAPRSPGRWNVNKQVIADLSERRKRRLSKSKTKNGTAGPWGSRGLGGGAVGIRQGAESLPGPHLACDLVPPHQGGRGEIVFLGNFKK